MIVAESISSSESLRYVRAKETFLSHLKKLRKKLIELKKRRIKPIRRISPIERPSFPWRMKRKWTFKDWSRYRKKIHLLSKDELKRLYDKELRKLRLVEEARATAVGKRWRKILDRIYRQQLKKLAIIEDALGKVRFIPERPKPIILPMPREVEYWKKVKETRLKKEKESLLRLIKRYEKRLKEAKRTPEEKPIRQFLKQLKTRLIAIEKALKKPYTFPKLPPIKIEIPYPPPKKAEAVPTTPAPEKAKAVPTAPAKATIFEKLKTPEGLILATLIGLVLLGTLKK